VIVLDENCSAQYSYLRWEAASTPVVLDSRYNNLQNPGLDHLMHQSFVQRQ
jgi:hypothetical protein